MKRRWDVVALVALKCAVSAWALHVGFTHVSDDDYARVTIAQAFAHTPQLDPSGTSWLPFPFWLTGTAMLAFGRSLLVARGVAILSGVLGAVVVHQALLDAGVKRWAAWCGVAIAMCTPWNAWLGVATVPEALSASLMLAGVLTLAAEGSDARRLRAFGAVALFLACLSRYEAWPVAVVFAVGCLARDRSIRGAVAPLVALLGPAAWIAWNRHAHGDALHFLARVAAYRLRMTSAGATPAGTMLSLYPEALVRAGPLTLTLAAVAVPGLLVDPTLRRRWLWPLLSMLALLLFLIEGDLQNGAPTHHPERALLALFWTGATFGIDGARSLAVRFVWARPKREASLVALVTALTVAWGIEWSSRVRDYPAKSESEDRTSQLARGEELRARGVGELVVTPCAYEHFALIAAFEAPERVTVAPSGSGGGECPRVVAR